MISCVRVGSMPPVRRSRCGKRLHCTRSSRCSLVWVGAVAARAISPVHQSLVAALLQHRLRVLREPRLRLLPLAHKVSRQLAPRPRSSRRPRRRRRVEAARRVRLQVRLPPLHRAQARLHRAPVVVRPRAAKRLQLVAAERRRPVAQPRLLRLASCRAS